MKLASGNIAILPRELDVILKANFTQKKTIKRNLHKSYI